MEVHLNCVTTTLRGGCCCSTIQSVRSLTQTNGVRTEQENPHNSRTMLTKLTKQQHLLLQELGRTKRRLREEIWAREERTATDNTAQPIDSGDPLASWRNQGRDATIMPSKKALGSPSRCRNDKQSSRMADTRRDPNTRGGARLKRSRSEAGMCPVEGDVGGAGRARAMHPEDNNRPSMGSSPMTLSTRIDLLPVMCTTGE